MSAGSSFQLGVIGSLALSVASSVAIVICNKALISTLGFPFATTLTSWHLMVTFSTLHVAQRLRLFEPKFMDGRTVVLFGLLNGSSIGFLNLSLGFNSIGFYQMTKLAIIPFTVLLETAFLDKKFRSYDHLRMLLQFSPDFFLPFKNKEKAFCDASLAPKCIWKGLQVQT